jgi:hypothetical protein
MLQKNPEQQNINQVGETQKIKSKKKGFIITGFISLIVLGMVLGSVYYLNTKSDNSENKTSKSDNSIFPQKPAEVIIEEQKKPLKTDDIRLLAQKRLEEVSGGIKLFELENLKNATSGTNTARTGGTNEAQTSQPNFTDAALGQKNTNISNAAQNTPNTQNQDTTVSNSPDLQIQQQKAQDLIKENKVEDNFAFYFETEKTAFLENYPAQYTNFYEGSFIDYSKPAIYKTWYSANYYKTLTLQEDDIKQLSVNTPNTYLDFYGGKYAIEQNFTTSNYFNGIGYGNSENINFEVAFLKAIINDKSLVDKGFETVEGVELKVLETDSLYYYNQTKDNSLSSEVSTLNLEIPIDLWKTKYFIDLEKFELKQSEYFLNDKIISRDKTIQSRKLENISPQDLFKAVEIENLEIKKFDTNNDYANLSSLTEFVKKYPLLYFETDINRYNIYGQDYSLFRNTELEKAQSSRDFNPNIPPDFEFYESKEVGYSGQDLNLNFTIFKEKPPFAYPGSKVETTDVSNFSFKINNTDTVQAEVYELKILPEKEEVSPQEIYRTQKIRFEYKGFWYETENDSFKFDNNTILNTLSGQDAQKIDEQNSLRARSYPEFRQVLIEDLEQQNLLLPGNLKQSLNLTLSGIEKNQNNSDKPSCEAFIESSWYLSMCLTNINNGHILRYSTSFDEQKPGQEYKNLTFYVLDKKIDLPQIQQYLQTVNNSNLYLNYERTPLRLETENGLNIIIDQISPDFSTKTYLLETKENLVMIETYGNFESNQLSTIVSSIAQNKDLEALEAQLEESSSQFYPYFGGPGGFGGMR